MGSHPTLDHPPDPQEPTQPTARQLQAAGGRFHAAHPDPAPVSSHPNRQLRAQLQRGLEDQQARGLRAWNQEALENPPTPPDIRLAVLRDRAAAAQLSRGQAEWAFDRLNPDFGLPADRSDRIGHRDLTQRERALALGIRVAVHDARQNDRDPVIWQPGQDYRMADALHAARTQPTRTRWGPERTGPER
jgi:hypothetical protein